MRNADTNTYGQPNSYPLSFAYTESKSDAKCNT